MGTEVGLDDLSAPFCTQFGQASPQAASPNSFSSSLILSISTETQLALQTAGGICPCQRWPRGRPFFFFPSFLSLHLQAPAQRGGRGRRCSSSSLLLPRVGGAGADVTLLAMGSRRLQAWCLALVLQPAPAATRPAVSRAWRRWLSARPARAPRMEYQVSFGVAYTLPNRERSLRLPPGGCVSRRRRWSARAEDRAQSLRLQGWEEMHACKKKNARVGWRVESLLLLLPVAKREATWSSPGSLSISNKIATGSVFLILLSFVLFCFTVCFVSCLAKAGMGSGLL